jgi:hypothetical protein
MLIKFATNCTNHKAQKLTPTNFPNNKKKKTGTKRNQFNEQKNLTSTLTKHQAQQIGVQA